MKLRVATWVTAAWILVGVLQAAQATVAARLEWRELSIGQALQQSLVQTIPWIPVTLAVIALAVRFPLTRTNWRTRIPIHLAGALFVAIVANVLLVLAFWILQQTSALSLDFESVEWTSFRLDIAIVLYAAIASGTQMIVARREARERELHLARVEGQLARARVQALTAQIRPHFLFNTLHTIGQLWRSGRSDEADRLLDHLGALFHRVQDTTSRTEISLDEELEMVRDYLAIEEARFRDRLRVAIDAETDALECAVPPLILQPIVENAVRHGISTTSSAGSIEISASIVGAKLRLVVHDDGPGIGAATSRPGSGTGLSNTRERLAQLYGDAASLSIDGSADEGTTVRIELPVRRLADAEPRAEARTEATVG